MRVKLRCPNKECRKVLTLEIPKPGVGVRCKSCGTAFRVPKSAGGAKPAKPADEEEIEEIEDIEEYEEDIEDAPRRRRPSGRSRPGGRRRSRDDYDEEEYDEFEDDEDEYDDRRPTSRSRSSSSRSSGRRSGGGRGGWNNVRLGAKIIAITAIVFTALHGFQLLIQLLTTFSSGSPGYTSMSSRDPFAASSRFYRNTRDIFALCQSLCFIPLIVGAVFALMAPSSKVKGLFIAALSCFSLGLIFTFIHSLRLFGSGPARFPNMSFGAIHMGYWGFGILSIVLSGVVLAGFILACFGFSAATSSKKKHDASGFCSIAAYLGIGQFGLIFLGSLLMLIAVSSGGGRGWYYVFQTFRWIGTVTFLAVSGIYIKAFFGAKNAL